MYEQSAHTVVVHVGDFLAHTTWPSAHNHHTTTLGARTDFHFLNPPQGAIMAVGRGRDFLSVDERDSTKLVSTPRLSATVSADARAADAADVARFLEAFKDALENPEGGDGKEKWAL